MGQADVLRWLEEHPGWHDKYAISAALGDVSNQKNVEIAIRILKRNREIECKVVDGKKGRLYRFLQPNPRGRAGRSVENRVGQAWRSGSVQVIGEDIFGNAKVFDLPDGHFQCRHCLTVVRIDERGFAACENCGLIYNDGKIEKEPHNGRMSARNRKKLIYECNHNKG